MKSRRMHKLVRIHGYGGKKASSSFFGVVLPVTFFKSRVLLYTVCENEIQNILFSYSF